MYQRKFTWGPDHVTRLFEDIHAGVDRVADNTGPPAFLGSVILFESTQAVEPRHPNALPTSVRHVVDGQQRITTWLLICAVLARRTQRILTDLEATIPADSDAPAATGWVIDLLQTHSQHLTQALHFDDARGDRVFRLKPRMIRQGHDVWGNNEQDAKYESPIAWFLHSIAREFASNTPAPTVPQRFPNLRLIIEVITEAISNIENGVAEDCHTLSLLEFITNPEACARLLQHHEAAPTTSSLLTDLQRRGIRLAVLASFLFWDTRVVEVLAPNESYAFTLFEPLNTTGQPLTPIETLKPLVVQSEGGASNFVNSPGASHLSVVDEYLPEDLSDSQRTRRIDSLVTAFALAEEGKKVGRRLIDQRGFLRGPYSSRNFTLEERRRFTKGLATTAEFLNDVWDDETPSMSLIGSPHNRLCLEVLRTTHHTITIPLLIRYYERAQKTGFDADRETFQVVLRGVTAFWTLWRTARTTTSGIDSVHRRFLREGHPPKEIPSLMRAAISTDDLPTGREVCTVLKEILDQRLKNYITRIVGNVSRFTTSLSNGQEVGSLPTFLGT